MKIATVVLSWNRRDDTIACLASLAGQESAPDRHEILLVDNGSTDGTPEAVARELPHVAVVALPHNHGFAAAANLGITRALESGADFTWLVNNDTVALPGLLRRLVDAAGAPTVGMATPTVNYMDRPEEVWPSAGCRRGLTLAAFDTTADPPGQEPYDVDWATGCCLLVRSAVWREVGLFDPRYSFYYEDHDLCLRARDAGWRIVHVPAARVLHKVAASTGQGSPRQMYLLARSSVPYYWLHTSGTHRAFIVAYRLGSLVHTLLACLAGRRPRSGVAYLRGLAAGIVDLVRGQSRMAVETE